jgi:hypothetical protein
VVFEVHHKKDHNNKVRMKKKTKKRGGGVYPKKLTHPPFTPKRKKNTNTNKIN